MWIAVPRRTVRSSCAIWQLMKLAMCSTVLSSKSLYNQYRQASEVYVAATVYTDYIQWQPNIQAVEHFEHSIHENTKSVCQSGMSYQKVVDLIKPNILLCTP